MKQRSRKPKQLSFLPSAKDTMAGVKRGTHAKTKRPLVSGKPLHVCMRSSMARGSRTMQGCNRLRVRGIVDQASKKFHVKILKFANVGNHLHLVVKLPSRGQIARDCYGKWIRRITSCLARDVGGSKRGAPLKDSSGRTTDDHGKRLRFWDAIPYTRVIHGGHGFRVMDRYVLKNELEAQGLGPDLAEVLALEHFESSRIDRLPLWKLAT